jgi:hypothetical protein
MDGYDMIVRGQVSFIAYGSFQVERYDLQISDKRDTLYQEFKMSQTRQHHEQGIWTQIMNAETLETARSPAISIPYFPEDVRITA